jgi:pimeloyl-ACP methyl ester carboxylesterase
VEPGRRLHYVCIGPVLRSFSGGGNGDPLVLFEVSGFSNSLSFREARAGVSQRARVCSYDRAGIGWSDGGPSRIPVSMLARDLGVLLDELSPRAPVILVGSSVGGFTIEFFAREHPERVAGLVFLDAGNSQTLRSALDRRYLSALGAIVCNGVRAAGAMALIRLWDPWHMRDEPSEQAARSAALMYGAKPWVMLCSMVRAARETAREFDEVPALPRGLPVTALSAETREEFLPPALARVIQLGGSVDALRATHQRLAQGSDRGTWRVVPGSTHLIASSHPQAVIDAVTEMLRLTAETTSVSGSGRTAER